VGDNKFYTNCFPSLHPKVVVGAGQGKPVMKNLLNYFYFSSNEFDLYTAVLQV
jgi:hypothetical protein